MLNKVKETIEKYNLIDKDDKIVVAVSGGPDSISLLDILYKLNYNICVAHVNHGLRENAVIDQKFVEDFCNKRNIPCFVKQIKLKELKDKMTLEEAGRKERYDFFYEVMKSQKCNKIATAHNSNDNAETVIMNIIRGSGVSGLKGIEPIRDNVIRPLIEITRKEIEAYCKENELNPRHDESNDEDIYTRNKVRLKVIPYIEENINSNVVNNINRLSSIVLEEEKYIEKEAEKAYNECLIASEENRNAKDIEKIHIDDIVKLCDKNIGGKFLMPNKRVKISIIKGTIECIKMC